MRTVQVLHLSFLLGTAVQIVTYNVYLPMTLLYAEVLHGITIILLNAYQE